MLTIQTHAAVARITTVRRWRPIRPKIYYRGHYLAPFKVKLSQ